MLCFLPTVIQLSSLTSSLNNQNNCWCGSTNVYITLKTIFFKQFLQYPMFGRRIINKNVWPTSNPDLIISGLHLWGTFKTAVYANQMNAQRTKELKDYLRKLTSYNVTYLIILFHELKLIENN